MAVIRKRMIQYSFIVETLLFIAPSLGANDLGVDDVGKCCTETNFSLTNLFASIEAAPFNGQEILTPLFWICRRTIFNLEWM